jgi:hypothetical protein
LNDASTNFVIFPGSTINNNDSNEPTFDDTDKGFEINDTEEDIMNFAG